MDSYTRAYKLMRLALGVLEHASGGAGVFFLWASFYRPSGAIFALMLLTQATGIALTMPKPAR